MTKNLFITIIMMLICVLSVSAATQIFTEGGSGLPDSSGESQYIGFSLNMLNGVANITNSSYETCVLPASTYNPVIIDTNNDGYSYVLLTTSTQMLVYDRRCSIIQTLTTPYAITGAPSVNNHDQDSSLNVFIPNQYGFSEYEWDSGSSLFINVQTFYNSTLGTINYLTCPLLTSKCIGFDDLTNRSIVYDLTTGTMALGNVHTASTAPGTIPNLLSPYQVSSVSYKIPYCASATSSFFQCSIYDQDGSVSQSFNAGAGSFAPTSSISYSSAYYANLGATKRMFISVKGYSGAWYQHVGAIFDDAGSNVKTIKITANIAGRYMSNWAVGDINKDGTNDACILYDAFNGTTWFECYNAQNTAFIKMNVTNDFTEINNIALADFDPSRPTLGIATYEGVYYINLTTNTITKWLSSGLTGEGAGYIQAYRDGSGTTSPIVVYAGTDSGFIMTNSNINANCGNDICDLYENIFSCPADCVFETTTQLPDGTFVGTNATLCASGYQEYGRCALKADNMDCSDGDECLSQSCTNGKCDKHSIWDGIDYSRKQQFGDDENSKNFVSLFIMIVVGMSIIFAGRSLPAVMVASGVFMAMAIFFTIVGWLSVFILVGIILIALIALVLLWLLSSGG